MKEIVKNVSKINMGNFNKHKKFSKTIILMFKMTRNQTGKYLSIILMNQLFNQIKINKRHKNVNTARQL